MEILLLVLVLLGCGGPHGVAGLLDSGGQPLVWEPLVQQPFDLLYTGGLREYQRGHWDRAICLLERALLAHSALRRLRARCQRLCGPSGLPPRGGVFSSFLQTAACLQHCLTVCLGQPSRHRVTQQIQTDFQRRTAYNYLQLAYYRVKEVDKAAAAAQTFFEMNPDHQEMRENLEMYRKMEGVKPEDFRDLEAQPHWVSYSDGLTLYRSEQFAESIPPLERAIEEYMTELEECQAQCEGPYQSPDYNYLHYQSHLYEAISDHYIQVLGCKQDCVRELATKPGSAKAIEDFLPSHFYLLQSAYHKVGNYEKAVECSRTFLLFRPEDSSVQQNLDFYRSKLPAGETDEILPREDIKVHINESLLQKEMLFTAMDSLGVPFNDPDSWTPAELVPPSIRNRPRWESSEDQMPSAETETVPEEAPEIKTEKEDGIAILRASPPFTNLKVLMDWNQLGGSQRVVFDGLLAPEECMALRNLGNAAAAIGAVSGSDSPADPLSGHRETLTILRALRFARDGLLQRENAGLYPDVSERVKMVTQAQFSPSSPLHLTFSQLECQGARGVSVDTPRLTVPGSECLWDPEAADCWTESAGNPAREFSAFLYLNDEFEGGEFFFTDPDGEITSGKISPKCGRLVTFTSSSENSHNVHRVTGGQRCIIALWFSHDSKQNEEDRVGAAVLLEQLFPPLPLTTGTAPSSPPGNLPPEARPQGQPTSQPEAKKPKKKKKGKKSRTPAKDEL